MAPALHAQRRAAYAPRPGAGRVVVVSYCAADAHDRQSHESVTRSAIAERLAAVKGCGFAGEFEREASYDGDIYFVPSATIVGCEGAAALGIRGADDLFGGVVPYPFVGTKTITHPLVDDGAHAPQGWSSAFCDAVSQAVLDGYSAFTREDAARAGAKLLASGAVRVKPALALGGRGQTVVRSLPELREAVEAIDPRELEQCGVVLEQNLTDVATYSVGQVQVGELVASYVGTQSLAIDNRGHEVYGGSDLIVARGDFDALLALDIAPALARAARDAQIYDRAAHVHFPGFFASRRNYDVVEGVDAKLARRTGVLEQSWRVGGASGAEVAALEWFANHDAAGAVHAWCVEVYGESEPPPPEGATVYFRGVDDQVGYLTKYTMIEPYGDA